MGHFKCRKEAKSQLLKLNFTVEDDLDEFFRTDKKRSAPKIIKDSDSIDLQESSVDSEYDDSADVDDKSAN